MLFLLNSTGALVGKFLLSFTGEDAVYMLQDITVEEDRLDRSHAYKELKRCIKHR